MAYTELLFLSDTFQFEVSSTITACGEDDNGPYVVTAATVFYPGGGGQEPDKGILITEDGVRHPIRTAAFSHKQMRHYLSEKLSGEGPISICIDREYRLQNARLHTGGHLLSSIIYEKLKYPLMPVKGFHYQQGSYMEFEPMKGIPEVDQEILNQALAEDVKQSLPVTTVLVSKHDTVYKQAFKPEGFIPPEDHPLRLVTINGYLAYPCGGTHLHHTGELNRVRVKHVKHKKGNIRIAYEAG